MFPWESKESLELEQVGALEALTEARSGWDRGIGSS